VNTIHQHWELETNSISNNSINGANQIYIIKTKLLFLTKVWKTYKYSMIHMVGICHMNDQFKQENTKYQVRLNKLMDYFCPRIDYPPP
jgi:hypothetical protein